MSTGTENLVKYLDLKPGTNQLINYLNSSPFLKEYVIDSSFITLSFAEKPVQVFVNGRIGKLKDFNINPTSIKTAFDITNNQFINLCIGGDKPSNESDTIPTDGRQNAFLNGVKSKIFSIDSVNGGMTQNEISKGNKDLTQDDVNLYKEKNGLTAGSIKSFIYLQTHVFSFRIDNYPDYKPSKKTITFSNKIDTTSMQTIMGILLLATNNNPDDETIDSLLTLIKFYSGLTQSYSNNDDFNASQKACLTNYNDFEKRLRRACEYYKKTRVETQKTGQITTEENNIEETKTPTIKTDESIEQQDAYDKEGEDEITKNQRIIRKNGSQIETQPNQFTQPNENDILSILDVIREEPQDPLDLIKNSEIYKLTIIEKNSSTKASSETDCIGAFLDKMDPKQLLDIIKSAREQLKENIKKLSKVNLDLNKLKSSSQFSLTSMLSGIESSLSNPFNHTKEYLDEIAKRIKDDGKAIKNIVSSSLDDLQNLPDNLKLSLNLPNLDTSGKIDWKTIKKKMGDEAENICSEVNDLMKSVNKRDTKETLDKTKNTAFDFRNKLTEKMEEKQKLENQQSQLQSVIAQAQSILNKK
jgi:hypothetical protein